MLLQTTVSSAASVAYASPFGCRHCYTTKNPPSLSLTKTPFLPLLDRRFHLCGKSSNTWRYDSNGNRRSIAPSATLLEAPVLWAGRLCIFYALLKAGLAGSPDNPIVSGTSPPPPSLCEKKVFCVGRRKTWPLLYFLVDMESGGLDLGFSKWFGELSKPGLCFSYFFGQFLHYFLSLELSFHLLKFLTAEQFDQALKKVKCLPISFDLAQLVDI